MGFILEVPVDKWTLRMVQWKPIKFTRRFVCAALLYINSTALTEEKAVENSFENSTSFEEKTEWNTRILNRSIFNILTACYTKRRASLNFNFNYSTQLWPFR